MLRHPHYQQNAPLLMSSFPNAPKFGSTWKRSVVSSALCRCVPNWMASFMIARPGTIYAGTSQVQRNIVGERVLGLPKEPRADGGTWKESQAAYN